MGDYIDRGDNSRAVIDQLLAFNHDYNCIFLKGNHEWLFEQAKISRKIMQLWHRNGGDETLISYGSMAAITALHGPFFNALALYYETQAYIFVHAGIRPGIPLYQQAESDLLWIREDFLDAPVSTQKCVVHGHTPVRDVQIQNNKINVDTGAVYGGPLSAIVLPEKTVIQVS